MECFQEKIWNDTRNYMEYTQSNQNQVIEKQWILLGKPTEIKSYQ